jgi:hypothetical protein
MKCEIGRDARPRIVEIDASLAPFGFFLETDVGGDVGLCHEILAALDRVEEGLAEEVETGANVHEVTISRDGVVLENDMAFPPVSAKYSLQPVRELIREWLQCILELPMNDHHTRGR